MSTQRTFLAAVLVGLWCLSSVATAQTTRAARNVVAWISVDGLCGSYIDADTTPFLHKLSGQGAYTRQLRPVFPSITFPSHASIATGTPVRIHGISGNDFRDSALKRIFRYPDQADLLEAEPIWITAARQGIRTAVLSWPLSYAQAGPGRAAYFAPRFDPTLSDAQRLENLMRTWREDRDAQPLQLLLGYIKDTDTVGHRSGPDSRQVRQAAAATDALLEAFHGAALRLVDQRLRPDDDFYFIVSGDHGMSKVHTLVNLRQLLGPALPRSAHITDDGALAQIYLDDVPPGDWPAIIEALRKALEGHDYVRLLTRQQIPRHWQFDHPRRTGDLLLVLRDGYCFSRRAPATTCPADPRHGALGMHGYDPAESPQVMAFALIWRYRKPIGGVDLKETDALRLHPTVAALLGIRPSEQAVLKDRPLLLPATAPTTRP